MNDTNTRHRPGFSRLTEDEKTEYLAREALIDRFVRTPVEMSEETARSAPEPDVAGQYTFELVVYASTEDDVYLYSEPATVTVDVSAP